MANYPTPSQGGPPYLKYLKERADYSAITIESTFEDGGKDFNTSADAPPQFWVFEYDGLTDTQADVLDDFWDTYGLSGTFDLIEPRNEPWTGVGSTITGVRFDSYEKDHRKVKNIQKRTVRLVKYPS